MPPEPLHIIKKLIKIIININPKIKIFFGEKIKNKFRSPENLNSK